VAKASKKFDVANVFFKDQHDQVTKTRFLQSPLFPIFVAAYNSTGGELRVGAIKYDRSEGAYQTTWKTMFVSQEGFPVGMVSAKINDSGQNSSFSYHAFSGVAESFGASTSLLTTTNPRYLQSKLSSSSTHDVLTWLRRSARDARYAVGEGIRTLIDNFIDKNYGESLSSRPRININDEVGTCLANIVMGNMSLNDIPTNTRASFDRAFKEYEEKKAKFSAAIDKAKGFITGDKWILLPSLNEGVYVGAIIGDHIKDALDTYVTTGCMPSTDKFNYTNYSVAPQWYKSMQDIPEEYRNELEYSLAMLKVHRNSSDMIPKPEGWGHTHWAEVGSALYQHSGSMILLQR